MLGTLSFIVKTRRAQFVLSRISDKNQALRLSLGIFLSALGWAPQPAQGDIMVFLAGAFSLWEILDFYMELMKSNQLIDKEQNPILRERTDHEEYLRSLGKECLKNEREDG